MKKFLIVNILALSLLLASCTMYKSPDEVQAYSAKQNQYSNILSYKKVAKLKNSYFYAAARLLSHEEEKRLFSEDLPDKYLVIAVCMRNNSKKTYYYTGLHELYCDGKKVEPVQAYDIAESLYGHFWLSTRVFTGFLLPEGEGTEEIMNEKQRRDNFCYSNVFNRSLTAEILRKREKHSDFVYYRKPSNFDPKKLELKLTFQNAYDKLKYFDMKVKVNNGRK